MVTIVPAFHPAGFPFRDLTSFHPILAPLFADPVHPAAEPAGEDAAGQVLRPARGLGKAQGRVRGERSQGLDPFACRRERFHLVRVLSFFFFFFAVSQVHRLVVNRDPKFTNFVEVIEFSILN
jgi:hypothetical protein